MHDAPPTRSDLRRALVLNALGKPVNVLVPAAVLVACALLSAGWLVLLALACWLALALHTFLDGREAARVGARLRVKRRPAVRVEPGEFTPLIAGRVKAAMRARQSIQDAIAASSAPFDDVGREVDALVSAIAADAARAQRIHVFLIGEEPMAALERRIAHEAQEPVRAALEDKRHALARLQRRLDALMAEMDQAVTTLQTLHAQLVATGDDALGERLLASHISELRERVELVSAGLEEAFAQTRDRRPV